jgi:thiol:disulfide interchange protein DsbD
VVKYSEVVLGFPIGPLLEFLSNADLVLQLHFLEEVFLAIWIAIFGTLAFYLLSLCHMIAVDTYFSGKTIVWITGSELYYLFNSWTMGSAFKISAFPPSVQYSESPFGVGGGGRNNSFAGEVLRASRNSRFEDYDKGLARQSVNKPIMPDFTGYACEL